MLGKWWTLRILISHSIFVIFLTRYRYPNNWCIENAIRLYCAPGNRYIVLLHRLYSMKLRLYCRKHEAICSEYQKNRTYFTRIAKCSIGILYMCCILYTYQYTDEIKRVISIGYNAFLLYQLSVFECSTTY